MLIADNSHRFSPIHQEFQGIFKGDCTDWHSVRMSCLNFTPILYHGGTCIGQVNIYLQYEDYNVMNVIDKGVRITHFSSSSNRCPPLVVLHTIASSGVLFKMEQHPQTDLSALNHIHSTCLKEAKTAIIPVGVMELHLVAMKSLNGQNKVPCFWGFLVSSALYNSCLQMLNIRCLAIVFDLDETLLVANTMRSFEDRIDALHRKIASEIDTHRVSGMLAEIKQYQEDKTILKQYAENDEIIDNGKLIKVQYEAVPPLADNQCTIERPLIRLQERNMILTRIHPNIRDTSVLVRLRPAWEYFKNFLTVKGRKRFEVFVCTMAERDYALEMWRLLDPEACLINSMELPHRVVCVKSGSKKSLLNVLHDEICHPKMTMIVDDRLNVWEDKDQSCVQVVQAFSPYSDSQAETKNRFPALHIARDVAYTVRGGFFKYLDECLLKDMQKVFYETDVTNLPSAPNVSNYVISQGNQDNGAAPINNRELPITEGVDFEVERKQNQQDPNVNMQSGTACVVTDNKGLKSEMHTLKQVESTVIPSSSTQAWDSILDKAEHNRNYSLKIPAVQPLKSLSNGDLDSNGQDSHSGEGGEVPKSELDPDVRRRLLILCHGQDNEQHKLVDPRFPLKCTLQITIPPVRSPVRCPGPEEISSKQLIRPSQELVLQPGTASTHKKQSRHPSVHHALGNNLVNDKDPIESKRQLPEEGCLGDDTVQHNHVLPPHSSCSDEEASMSNIHTGRLGAHNVSNAVDLLKKISMKCGQKVEFRHGLNDTTDLQFHTEVLFGEEKVGKGIGGTRKEAQLKAAEDALRCMASQYVASPGSVEDGLVRGWHEEGFRETCSSESVGDPQEIDALSAATPGHSNHGDQWLSEDLKRPYNSVDTLKHLCTMGGLSLVFQDQTEIGAAKRKCCAYIHSCAQEGRILGEGSSLTWKAAKLRAAEEGLRNLKSEISQPHQKELDPPRYPMVQPNKRIKYTRHPRSGAVKS